MIYSTHIYISPMIYSIYIYIWENDLMFHTPDMLWAMFSLMFPIYFDDGSSHKWSFPKWGPYGTMDEAIWELDDFQ
jgi:hypothetical protein